MSKMANIQSLSTIKIVSVKEYEIAPDCHRTFHLTFHFFLCFMHLKYILLFLCSSILPAELPVSNAFPKKDSDV